MTLILTPTSTKPYHFVIPPNYKVSLEKKCSAKQVDFATLATAGKPRFSSQPFYTGSFQRVNFFTDFNDGASNAEAILRLRDTLNFVTAYRPVIIKHLKKSQKTSGALELNYLNNVSSLIYTGKERVRNLFLTIFKILQGKNGFLEVNTFADIPYGNINYSSLTIQRVTNRTNREIHVHVTDPGVGNDVDNKGNQLHNRSILVTKKYGILIGPNNGSLGIIAKSLQAKGESCKLFPIDLAQVQEIERLRRNNPKFELPETFHARDAFAIVAAAISAGVTPSLFADLKRKDNLNIEFTPFSETIQSIPLEKNKEIIFYALRDNTFGNAKTNLILSAEDLKRLIADNASYLLNSKDGKLNDGKGIELPVKKYFSQVKKDNPLIYQGSTESPEAGRNFIELALNRGNISNQISLTSFEASPFTLKRIK